MSRVLIWDLPTRLFHWLFAASFAGAWLTAEADQWLSLHTFLGYLMLGLIIFRLGWGLVGGRYARFASFLYGPLEGLAYLRAVITGRAERHLGHNPAGSQAVFLLLVLGLVVGLAGLFVQGGEERHGISANWLGFGLGHALKAVHEAAANLMLIVVIGHLAGVALEIWRHRENLPRSLVTGRKEAPDDAMSSKPYRLAGVFLLIAVAGFGLWWFQPVLGSGRADAALTAPQLASDSLWHEECGSCHLDFHPSLLPARSWKRLLAEQNRHFGEDLGLDQATLNRLATFALNHAAERRETEPAFKIARSLKRDETPLRISETPYWVKKHRNVSETDWHSPKVKSRANCAACHRDAEAGTFEDGAVRIPGI